MTDAASRFHTKYVIDEATGCWLWTASLIDGYGQFKADYSATSWRAHRFSWTHHCGPIPDDMHVLHRCDVRRCVNPDHLFLGTDMDNVHDMLQKRRGNPPRGDNHWSRSRPALVSRGEHRWSARLTERHVILMRRLHRAGHTPSQLSRLFSVSVGTVNDAVRRVTWRHLADEVC